MAKELGAKKAPEVRILLPGERRILEPYDALALAKQNPIIDILNQRTLDAKFGGGWDPIQFNPVQAVNVLTADGPQVQIVDGYHRLGVYTNNVDPEKKEKIIDEDIATTYPDFKFTVLNVTESCLRNPKIVPPGEEKIEFGGIPMLTPEQLARARLAPTEEQPLIEQERKAAYLSNFWEQKIGQTLAATYPVIFPLMAGYDRELSKQDPDYLFPKADPIQQEQLAKGLLSLVTTASEINIDLNRAINELLLLLGEDIMPSKKLSPQIRMQLGGLLSLPPVRAKIEQKSTVDTTRDELTEQLENAIAKRLSEFAEENIKPFDDLKLLREVLMDNDYSFDETIQLIPARNLNKIKDKLDLTHRKEKLQKNYLMLTKKDRKDLSSVEQTLIEQGAKNNDNARTVHQEVTRLRQVYAPAEALLNEIEALRAAHPRQDSLLSQLRSRLVVRMHDVLKYPQQRIGRITSLKTAIKEVQENLKSNFFPPEEPPPAPTVSAGPSRDASAALAPTTSSPHSRDNGQFSELHTLLDTTRADLSAARTAYAEERTLRISAEEEAARLGERNRRLTADLTTARTERDAAKRASAAAATDAARLRAEKNSLGERLRLAEEELTSLKTTGHPTETTVVFDRQFKTIPWDTVLPNEHDWENAEWLDNAGGHDMEKMTVLINRRARKELFAQLRYPEIWDKILSHISYSLPEHELQGLDAIHYGLTSRLKQVAQDCGWHRESPEVGYLIASHYLNALGAVTIADNQELTEDQQYMQLAKLRYVNRTLKGKDEYFLDVLQLLLYCDPNDQAYRQAVTFIKNHTGDQDIITRWEQRTGNTLAEFLLKQVAGTQK